MRNQESPTDQAEFVQFMKGLCERMGNEAGTKWAMPVAVMLALVSMATEDAITANKAGVREQGALLLEFVTDARRGCAPDWRFRKSLGSRFLSGRKAR